ncbi:MAG: metallophosphoesterase [Pirellulales bacterium]|nr:metallophosphoesterase [Pirellulales bacterium]MBL7193929.1 metallophosphoesterase [Pirellulales bacterium]
MPIRIIHTADNHIGLSFGQYPDVAKRLVEERFLALQRLVAEANRREAHFFVVAGDLFDSTRVKAGDIDNAAAVLRGFDGVAAIVVPGNHDHFVSSETEVWKRFRRATEGDSRIDLLADPAVKSYEVEGQAVHFFPCPCPSKTGAEPMTGWVAEAAGEFATGLKIGIAHGNVTGLGLDAEGRYFNMEPAALEAAGMATWLLGHIHVPFPTAKSGERSPYFMAGTHTPDSLRCRHAGSAWSIECDGDRVTRYERLAPGKILFQRLTRDLLCADDVADLIQTCEALDARSTILDLQLSGRLSVAERASLTAEIEQLRGSFLSLTEESDIHDRIDAAQIEQRYRSGGLAQRLLTALLADADHPDAATLAHQLIEQVSQS